MYIPIRVLGSLGALPPPWPPRALPERTFSVSFRELIPSTALLNDFSHAKSFFWSIPPNFETFLVDLGFIFDRFLTRFCSQFSNSFLERFLLNVLIVFVSMALSIVTNASTYFSFQSPTLVHGKTWKNIGCAHKIEGWRIFIIQRETKTFIEKTLENV